MPLEVGGDQNRVDEMVKKLQIKADAVCLLCVQIGNCMLKHLPYQLYDVWFFCVVLTAFSTASIWPTNLFRVYLFIIQQL